MTLPADACGGSPSITGSLPHEYLSIRLGDDQYGIDLQQVREIRRHAEAPHPAPPVGVTKSPNSSAATAVPLLDLRRCFGHWTPRHDNMTVTIVVELGNCMVGIVADAVCALVALTNEHIRPAGALDGLIDARHVKGQCSVDHGQGEQMLILLDLHSLMRGGQTCADSSGKTPIDLESRHSTPPHLH